MPNARKIAVNALLEVRKQAYSNITLNKFLSDAELSSVDKSFITALFYGVLDRTITIDYVLSQFIKTPLKKVDSFVLEVLRVALYQIMYMDKIPDSAAVNEAVKIVKNSKRKSLSGFVNGVLRNILRDGVHLPQGNSINELSVRYSCPEWIVKSFTSDYGIENAINLLKSSLKTPPVTLRVNSLKTTTNALCEMLNNDGISAKVSLLDNAIDISGGIDITKSRMYKEGFFHVQDIASQTVVSVLNPVKDERVLDVCAAPGGKSFTTAQYMQNTGEIISCDLYEKRVELIKKAQSV